MAGRGGGAVCDRALLPRRVWPTGRQRAIAASWSDRWDQRRPGRDPDRQARRATIRADEYSPIVYGRGPLFVEALEKEMGQPAFDAFLRDYYQAHKWQIGTPETFRQMAEDHCACDLGPLFQEWVYD